MLKIYTRLDDIDFRQLMDIYIEGNKENAGALYPELSRAEGVSKAEADFYRYLAENFFRKDGAFYAVWTENDSYVSALRMEQFKDGLLLEALETKPPLRKMGYAVRLIEAVKQAVPGRIYCHVAKRNLPSLRTHEKCGFIRISERAVYEDGYESPNSCTLCLFRE